MSDDSPPFTTTAPKTMSNNGDLSLEGPVPTMFPNATVKSIKGGTFVAAVNYNTQAKEHPTSMDDLAMYLTY